MSNEKTKYVRDAENDQRVMTIVYRPTIRTNEFEYAVAVNRPTRFVCVAEDKFNLQFELVKGESFEKAEGRRICMERLENPRTANKDEVIVPVGTKPIIAILEHISMYSPHQIVRRIADQEFEFQMHFEDFNEKFANPPTTEAVEENQAMALGAIAFNACSG